MATAIPDIITAATKSTMPTDRTSRPARFWPELMRLAIGLSLGLALIWLAVPRTVGAFLNLPGDPVLEAMQTGRPVSNEELHRFVLSRERSLKWVDDGRAWSDLGLAHLRLAELSGYDTFSGVGYLAASTEALKTGLSKSPANPYAWARLAYLGLRQEGEGIDAKEALIMSLFTGPFERSLVDSRIEYALVIWHQLDVGQQDMIHEQIVFLARFDRRRLYQIARQDPSYRVIALTALAPPPERQAALRAALKKPAK